MFPLNAALHAQQELRSRNRAQGETFMDWDGTSIVQSAPSKEWRKPSGNIPRGNNAWVRDAQGVMQLLIAQTETNGGWMMTVGFCECADAVPCETNDGLGQANKESAPAS
jgi:hypothetical protein